MLLYKLGLNKSKATGAWIVLGHSREPPVFARFGGTSDETKIAKVGRARAKAAPSRRWAIAHHKRAKPFEDNDEYEGD